MIKIGIFSRKIDNLSNFEYRFYNWCKQQDWLEISVIFFDGRKKISRKSTLLKIFDFYIFSKIIFKLINKFDYFNIKYKKLDSNKKKEIIEWLNKIEFKSIFPNSNNYVDYFDEKLSNIIKSYDLDIIIRNEFGIIHGNILDIPKYGIWSFHHGDNDINRGGPAGFWEVFYHHKITGVTLQKLNKNLDGGDIIEKGYYPTQETFLRNNIFIIEKSLEILTKNLRILNFENIKYTKSKVYKGEIYKYPIKYSIILKYVWIFFKNTIFNKIKKKFFYLLKFKLNHWVIYISKTNDFNRIDLENCVPIKTNKNFFLADPFYIKYKKNDLLFYEKFDYKKNKGKIACSILNENKLSDEKIILDKEYHLSYPFVFQYLNYYYLMPEMSEAKQQNIYKSTNFPYEWKLHKIIFKNRYCADPTIFKDKNSQFWLFINQSSDPFNDLNSELYIYKIKNIDTFEMEPHKKNPVIIDSRCARNAGNIFFYNDIMVRPSQNTNSISYGNSINFSQIDKLCIHEYDERKIFNLNFNKKNIVGTHHFCSFNNKSILDVCFGRFFNGI
jgi:hypothetical protein